MNIKELLMQASKKAQIDGIANMTMEEIDAEIALMHREQETVATVQIERAKRIAV